MSVYLRQLLLLFGSGVDGSVTIVEGGDACRAFLGGGIYGFEKNFESELLVLICHLR